MSKPEIPKDLGIKIGTKEEVFWTKVLRVGEQEKEDCTNTIILQDEIIKIAKLKIAEEKEKMKA